jgi:two-component system, cell cycle response regulator
MSNESLVLIVDDDENGRDLLEGLLRREKCRSIVARDGREALNLTIAHLPDLILLDVMMPELDGYEVCKQIRENPQLAEIPILLLTALNDKESRLQGLEAGADDYITKPFDRLELRSRVRSILRLNRYRRLMGERQKFQWVAEHTQEGYLLLDNSQKICYINPKAGDYLHIRPQDIENNDFYFIDAVDKNYRRAPDEWNDWLLASPNSPQRHLVRPETPEAREMWLQVDVFNLTGNSQHLVRLTNISEQMRTMRQTWVFQDLVAHKLLTPVNGLALIEQTPPLDKLPDEWQEYWEIAAFSAKRLRKQVSEIIHYMQHIPKLLKPGSQCAMYDLRNSLIKLAEETKILLRITLPQPLEQVYIGADLELLSWIFRELFTNAKKFHPTKSPEVTVCSECPSNDKITLIISDNGRTLAQDELSKILKPYYQSEKYITGEIAGMGLGLTAINSLVRGLGGYCRVLNNFESNGVRVEITLPLEVSQNNL